MDDSVKVVCGKSLRPVRNRRYSRKSLGIGNKPAKRLFTPEIKRFLKEWLIRRRDNPYPNREEKKLLAVETGLTYIQICNWFANWRRKLKNAGNEDNRKTWGHLIKTYNNRAQGNVEQFSICSDDSIWGEPEPQSPDTCVSTDDLKNNCFIKNSCFYNFLQFSKLEISAKNDTLNAQCYDVSSTTTEENKNVQSLTNNQTTGNKYKNHIMEKYLKGLQGTDEKEDYNTKDNKQIEPVSKPLLLSKWLESAAKFQPQKTNYVSWNSNTKNKIEKKIKMLNKPNDKLFKKSDVQVQCVTKDIHNDLNNIKNLNNYSKLETILTSTDDEHLSPEYSSRVIHGREEVEAAVALTTLAGLYKC